MRDRRAQGEGGVTQIGSAHHCRGPWRTLDAVGYATLEWLDWLNKRRLLDSIGHVPPAEFEREYHKLNEAQAVAA
jgi:putative transposase